MVSNNLTTINITQVTGLPKLALLPDMSYLAPDCFHPSQKLHAKSKHQILFFLPKYPINVKLEPVTPIIILFSEPCCVEQHVRRRPCQVLLGPRQCWHKVQYCSLHFCFADIDSIPSLCTSSKALFLQSFLKGVQPLLRRPRTTLEAPLPHHPGHQTPLMIHQLLMRQPGLNSHAFLWII